MTRLLALIVSFAMLVVPAALAKQGPAGNTHPQEELLRSENVVNPFGATPATSATTAAAKKAFAEALDLSPLRDIAVYHNGRIKILGTLAGETVSSIAARKDFFDVLPEEVGGRARMKKVKYDPLFTFMDIAIDPAFYDDKPLIGVPYHPLREDLLRHVWSEAALQPGQTVEGMVDDWMRLGRVTPAMVRQHGGHINALDSDGKLSQNKANALRDLEEALFEYTRLPATLMLVPAPADTPDAPWTHLGALDSKAPARDAARRLGEAWRAADAPAANAAIKALAEELPRLSGTYPTTRRTLEALYNKGHFFDYGMWLYCFATLFLLLAFGTGRPWLSRTGLVFLIAAVLMHAAGFALRSYIAERYSIQNQFESMTGVSLFAALVGLGLMVFKRQPIYAAAAAGVGFLVLIAATQTGIPGKVIAREAAILNTSVLLKYHVTTVLVSYGLIALGFIVSLFYLATHYAGKTRGAAAGPGDMGGGAVALSATALNEPAGEAGAPVGIHRVLADLDKAQMTILQLAFWVLGVGILLGAWWADHSWGRWWGWDPKEMWALVTWIIYLVVVHVRVAATTNKGLKTAWLSVVGFCMMLWCYFGVNLLLPGLHAYA